MRPLPVRHDRSFCRLALRGQFRFGGPYRKGQEMGVSKPLRATAAKEQTVIRALPPRTPGTPARDAAGQGRAPDVGPGTLHDPVELSRRVNRVISAVEPDMSREEGLAVITGLLAGSGHVPTVQWWNNLLDGVPNSVRRPEVLDTLAKWLDVDAKYFTHTERERDDRIEAELNLYRALREIYAQLMDAGIPDGREVTARVIQELTAILHKHYPTPRK